MRRALQRSAARLWAMRSDLQQPSMGLQDAHGLLSIAHGGHGPSHEQQTAHNMVLSSHITTMVKTGIPKPRPHIQEALSTFKGGHVARLIALAETMVELDDVLYKYRRQLVPVHMAAASLSLARLQRQEQHAPFAYIVKKIAVQIERFAHERAIRLTPSQLSSILRGLSVVGHTLSRDTLLQAAAVLLANNCQRLQLASEQDIKGLVASFSRQDFNNAIFWDKLDQLLVSRISASSTSWSLDGLAHIVFNFSRITPPSNQLLDEAIKHIVASPTRLSPPALAAMLASLADVGNSRPAAALALRDSGVSRMLLFDHKALTRFAAATAKLGILDGETARAVSAAASSQAHNFQLLHICKLVEALAAAKYEDQALYSLMAGQVSKLLPGCQPEEVAMVQRAFRKPVLDSNPAVQQLVSQAGDTQQISQQ